MKVSAEVINVLDQAEVKGNSLVLVGKLDRKLYTDTNKVLEALGGKWNRKAGAHLFDEDVSEILEQVVQTGEYTRTKQDFGQFDTPPELADEVVALADIGPNMKVYEPSCGIGEIVHAMRRRAFELGSMHIFANEIDTKRFEITRGKFFIAGGITNQDFLSLDPAPVFDRIVMNPPFAKQADIDHVTHAMGFLKDDGCLVSIMSAGTIHRENRKAVAFREMMGQLNAVWKQLPEGAFASSGTQVRTAIVRVWKDGRSQPSI